MKQHKGKKESIEIIKSAVNKMVDFLKCTYGPNNSNIIMKLDGVIQAMDDGVSVSKEFSLPDPAENHIIDFIKEVARKTSKRAKDGTTTSMLLLQAILETANHENNNFVSDLKRASQEAIAQLKEKAVEIDSVEDLKKVARISFNNPEIADTIAEVIHKVGKQGVVTVEESSRLETDYKIVNGLEFDKGYASPFMVNNSDQLNCAIDGAPILVTDKKITSSQDIVPIISKLLDDGKKEFVIICDDIDGEALSTLVLNKIKGVFTPLVIRATNYGDRRKEFLLDVCAIVDANLISDDFGRELKDANMEDLGYASRVISTRDTTRIINGRGKLSSIEERIAYYETQLKDEQNVYEQRRLKMNIASLNGGIAIIRVGANTEQEVKALLPKIENVANATLSAYKSGVVKGAGLALSEIQTSSKELNRALKYPSIVLKRNLGIEKEELITDADMVTNYVTEQYGNYLEVGVIDSVDVLIAAVESAVSVACLLLSSGGMMYEDSLLNNK